MGLSMAVVESHLIQSGYSQREVAGFNQRFNRTPEVWREFEAVALRLITQHKKAGAIDILARIRWERVVEQKHDAYKCNNNDAPILARVFALKYPQHSGFFEFRKVGS